MGADQTPDPTQMSDDQLDNLLDALAQRAAERDDLDLPGTGPSRRTVLAGLLGLGGAAAGAGVASAIGESESYESASGVVGTDSEPLKEANVQDLHAQTGEINTVQTKRVSNGSVSSIAQYDYGMGDGQTRQLDPQNPERPAVYIVYTDTGKFTGIFATDTVGSESVSKIAGGDVTTTDGNTGTLNIYWNDTDGAFKIENQVGFSLNVSTTRIGFDDISSATPL